MGFSIKMGRSLRVNVSPKHRASASLRVGPVKVSSGGSKSIRVGRVTTWKDGDKR